MSVLGSKSFSVTYKAGGSAYYLPPLSLSFLICKIDKFMAYNIICLIEWLRFLNVIIDIKCFMWCLVKPKCSINVTCNNITRLFRKKEIHILLAKNPQYLCSCRRGGISFTS